MTTNNQVEYEAILKGLPLLHEVKAESIEVFGDSQCRGPNTGVPQKVEPITTERENFLDA